MTNFPSGHVVEQPDCNMFNSTPPLLRSPSVTSFDWFDAWIRFSESPRATSIQHPRNSISLIDTLFDFAKSIDHYEKERDFERFVSANSARSECENCVLRSALDTCERYFAKKLHSEWFQVNKDEGYRENHRYASAAVHRLLQLWLNRNVISTDERIFGIGLTVSRLLLFQEKYAQAKSLLKAMVPEMERTGRTAFQEYAYITMARCNLMLGNYKRVKTFLGTIFESEHGSVISESEHLIFKYIESNMYCEEHRHAMIVYAAKNKLYLGGGSETTIFPFRLFAIHLERRPDFHDHLAWEEELWPLAIDASLDDDDGWNQAEDDDLREIRFNAVSVLKIHSCRLGRGVFFMVGLEAALLSYHQPDPLDSESYLALAARLGREDLDIGEWEEDEDDDWEENEECTEG